MSGNTLKGGEETSTDKITFRVPSHLKQQYKEQVDSMSSDLQSHVRTVVDDDLAPEQPTPPRDPPGREHLRRAYLKLCEIAHLKESTSGQVREKTAKRILSGGPKKFSADDVVRNLLHPLRKRGYLARTSDMYGNVSWHIRGWDDAE